MDARAASRNPDASPQAEVAAAPRFSAFNRSSKKVLSRSLVPVDAARDPIQVLRILMDGLPPEVRHGLWLVNFRGIPVARSHSPFDLVYLDNEFRVLQAAEISLYSKFVPFKGSPESALILPAGTNAASQTYTGDQLILEAVTSASEASRAPRSKRRAKSSPDRIVPASSAKSFNVPQENPQSGRGARVSGPLIRSAAQAVERPAAATKSAKKEKAEDPVTKRIEMALEQPSEAPAAAPESAPAAQPQAIAEQAARLPIDAARIQASIEAIAPLDSIEAMPATPPAAALSAPEVASTVVAADLTATSIASPGNPAFTVVETAPAAIESAAVHERAAGQQLRPTLPAQPKVAAPSLISDIAQVEDSKESTPPLLAALSVPPTLRLDPAAQAAAAMREPLQAPGPVPSQANVEQVAPIQQAQVETAPNPPATQPTPAAVPQRFTPPAPATPVPAPKPRPTQAAQQEPLQASVAPTAAARPTATKEPALSVSPVTPVPAAKRPPSSAPPEPRPKPPAAAAPVGPAQASAPERKAAPGRRPDGEDPHLVIKIDRATQQVMQAHQTDATVKAKTPKIARRWDVRLLYRMFPDLHPSYRPELQTPRVDPVKEAQKKHKQQKEKQKEQQELSKKVKVLHWLYPELGLDTVRKRQREVRRAPRIPLPGLVGYFFTGGVSLPFEIRNLSVMGFYMVTTERWMPGAVVRVTLQIVGTDGENPSDTLMVHARVVHWDRTGAGFEFVLPGFEELGY